MDESASADTKGTVTVVIIGAGPAGMASAVALKKVGIDAILLDENQEFAHSWRRHYQSLVLNSVAGLSGLPYKPMPSSFPRYPNREQVVEYLLSYAKEFELAPHWGERVVRIERNADAWLVHTGIRTLRSLNVVLATGANRIPRKPDLVGKENFRGKLLHSSEYVSGADFRDQRVLVIGAGNSAADIVMDLLANKARPCLSIRNPVHITPLDLYGVLPAQVTSILLGKLPLAIADAVGAVTLRLVYGDLSKYGLRRPTKGPIRALLEDQRVPMFDRGIVREIKRGSINVRPGIKSLCESSVKFVNGNEQPYEAIIFATGYTTNLPKILPDDLRGLVANGIEAKDDNKLAPGMYFIGFRESTRGALNDINLHSRRIAAQIAAQLNS